MYHTVAALIEPDVAHSSVAVGIFLELVVQRGPVAQVAPPEVGRMGIDKAISGGGFHHGKVDGDLLALREEVLHIARGHNLVHIGGNTRLVGLDAVGDGLEVPNEDAGIPEEIARTEVLLGGLVIGLLLERSYRLDLWRCRIKCGMRDGLHIAIARFGTRGLDANGHDGIVTVGEAEGVAYDSAELLGVHHHCIGRGHHHIGRGVFLTDAPAGPSDAGCRVAGSGFGKDMVGRNVGQLPADNLDVGGIGHHPEVPHRTDALEAVDGELYQRPPASQYVYELLRVLRRTQRPETAAHAPRHNYYVVVAHYRYFILSVFQKETKGTPKEHQRM